jgi:hypothetical protein
MFQKSTHFSLRHRPRHTKLAKFFFFFFVHKKEDSSLLKLAYFFQQCRAGALRIPRKGQ